MERRLAGDEAVDCQATCSEVPYRQRITDTAFRIIDRYIQFRLVSVHLARLDDVLHPQPTQRLPSLSSELPLGEVHGDGLEYSYVGDQTKVLCVPVLRIAARAQVAIVGPSGCGKTTLVKVLAGILEPTGGTVKHGTCNGRADFGGEMRPKIAMVLQNDQLFSGTILQNVCLFDESPDIDRARGSAALACALDFIESMPVGWETRLGDDAMSLSGGQRQRLLIARALYMKPDLLLLDEATAHLDTGTEGRVMANLRAAECTTIFVAHRPELIRLADQVIDLDKREPIRAVGAEVDPLAAAQRCAERS